MKIEKKQFKEIEFLFNQSMKGLHLLFDDNQRLHKILKTPTLEDQFFRPSNKEKIENLFTELISRKSFKAKKRYLDQLNPENFEILVRIYFHIVDNTLLTKNNTLH